jgi:hypothetical protein
LSSDAYREWLAFRKAFEPELGPAGRFEHVNDWGAKFFGLAARIAGSLHCADYAGRDGSKTPLSLSTMPLLAAGKVLAWINGRVGVHHVERDQARVRL